MIRRGEPWGAAEAGPPEVEVSGGDHELARAVAARRGVLVGFEPAGSDVARALGLRRRVGGLAVDLDAMRVGQEVGVNAVVFGVPPDRTNALTRARRLCVEIDGAPSFEGRATGVVVANGQFLRGLDLVPRGHPGDGRLEVQIYAVGPIQRRAMRRRLRTGAHVPHPDISEQTARRILLRAGDRLAVELDGVARAPSAELEVEVIPAAYRLLV